MSTAAPPAAVALAPRARRPRVRRAAAPAGLALLLAGGALCVRVAVLAAAAGGRVEPSWLFTAAALVLAGVALVLVALPRIAPDDGADEPEPPPPRG
ncbi:MAG: hypothetical protein MUE51_03610 [Thermoleophilia bacterium]|nr:hypothetical protein [Thermoleophilia bacterium]